jgi:hypothetical protein
MERHLFEQIVMSVCKSEDKTKQVMDIVYGNNNSLIEAVEFLNKTYESMFVKCENRHFYNKHKFSTCPYCEESKIEDKSSNKKQELIDSLDYLKKKDYKTDKDKESISIIQSILNGMK